MNLISTLRQCQSQWKLPNRAANCSVTLILGLEFAQYIKTVKKLKKKYPRIEEDLENLFSTIRTDPEKAARPIIMPGTGESVVIYRCRSADQVKGTRGGFRVICWRLKKDEVIALWPLLVYAKSENPKRPDVRIVNSLVRELKNHVPH